VSPLNATEDRFGGRTYVWKGEAFGSVTTIISGGVPKYLMPWAVRLVAEAAYDHREWMKLGREQALAILKAAPNAARDSAANLGKDIHAAAEAYQLGRPMPEWPEALEAHMESFVEFLEAYNPEYLATEATVYNRKERYAGTLDAVMVVDGEPLVVDYKSGKAVYAEVGLQLAAYGNAEFVGLPDGSEVPLPAVTGGAVLHLRADGFEFRRIDPDLWTSGELFRVFRYAREINRFAKETSRGVIGDLIPRKAVA